jgi:hypothetical protein
MHVLDLLGTHEPDLVADLIDWIVDHQNEAGFIDHPPQNITNFPHQPWWKNPDRERILMLAGIIKKWGIGKPAFFEKVSAFYRSTPLPSVEKYYGYPHFVYLKYCAKDEENDQLTTFINRLPEFLTMHRNHFPLLSRGWMYAREYVREDVWGREANIFLSCLQADGGVQTPYPDLPWWRPIWTLNGCILLHKQDLRF